MPCAVAILASTHLVRQPIAQSLTPLGFRVHEFAELAELALGVNKLAPRLVVVDIDGLEGKWRALAAALQGSQQRMALVLLAGAGTARLPVRPGLPAVLAGRGAAVRNAQEPGQGRCLVATAGRRSPEGRRFNAAAAPAGGRPAP